MNILLDPRARPVVAHRGNRAHAPENTIESFRQGIAVGADAIEFDLRVSRDGILVVMHDATVNRTTDGSGQVHEMSLHELQELDAGARFTVDGGRTTPWRGRGIRIPTFDEVIETLGDVPMVIELKTATATERVRAAIARHAIAPRVVVAGFDSRAVHPLRGAGFALGATTNDALRLLPAAFLGRSAGVLPFQTVNIPPRWKGLPVPFTLLAHALRASRTPIHVWTVNDAAEARRLWSAGVCGIISDDPKTILNARGTR